MTKKELQDKMEKLESYIEELQAQMLALNAPYPIYNEMHKEWMYFPNTKLEKQEIDTIFYGKGYTLTERKGVGK